MKSSAASRIQANIQDLFKAKLTPGNAYIRFQLTTDMTAFLSMETVEESLAIEPEKITPLPSMPESVIGIVNSRNRVFCVFDLAQVLALPSSLISPQQYQIIVLQTTEEQPLYVGLAVARIQGIVRFPATKIHSSLHGFSSEMAFYLSGTVLEAETAIPVLNFNSILLTLNTVV